MEGMNGGENMIPRVLKQFLEALPIENADKVWDFLEGEPMAIEDMIVVLAVSNPTLK